NEINDIGFTHFNQSVRVVKYLEKDFSGLNLTYEVIDGIANHTKGKLPETLEGVVVRISDKIAYLNHDIEDAISAKVLKDNEIPKDIINSLGSSKSVRITHLIKSIIENSLYKNQIIMDYFTQNAFDNLNTFMYKKVYLNPVAKFEEKKVFALIKNLYDYFYNNPEFLPAGYKLIMEKEGKNMAISDYIAGMTDSFAISFYEQLFVPKSWKIQQINNN
ncbi:MAG: deoxyguanosinetriphosphate triphosphohydrolase, partial [Oscillospiraceae bacterium]